MSKLLSICIMGRDDDYMLNFKYCIATTINYIARNLKQLGCLDDVEILVTDWGSQVPLAQTLLLSPESGQVCRFVYVPLPVVRAVQNGGENLHMALAMNSGLRRACGKFLMAFSADTLIPKHSLETILKLLNGELHVPIDVEHTYFLLSRYHVPWQFVKRQPNLNEWDRYLLLHAGEFEREGGAVFSISSGAGAIMMHRSLWHQFRGVDETLAGWGAHDVELGLRVTQYHPWVELSSLGVSLFHMDHSPFDGRQSVIRQKRNSLIYNPVFQVNDENWGLGNYELEIQIPQNICELEESGESFSMPLKSKSQKIQSWDCSRQRVLAELASKEVRNHIRRIIEHFIKDDKKWDISLSDMDFLVFLSWYSQYHYPRRYLELGIGQSYAAVVVGATCPSVEIYDISRWEGVLNRSAPVNIAQRLRRNFTHHGYVRFINGDINTAVQRLRNSFIGSFFFDLVFIQGDMLGEHTTKQVNELLTHLAPGGALVFTCSFVDSFKYVWNEAQKGFSQFSYFQYKSGKTGMILAASFQGEDERTKTEDCLLDIEPIEELLVNLKSEFDITHQVLFRRLYNAIKKPARYPEYVGRVYRWMKRKAFHKTIRQCA